MFEKILLFHFTENLNRHRLKLHYSQDLAIKRKPKNLSSSSNFCIVQTFILFSIWDLRFLRFSKRRPVDFIFTLLHLLSCVVACWFVVRRRKICTFLFISELSIDLRCRISKFENENQFRESLTTSLRRLFLWTWTIAAATKCLIIDISTPTSTIRSFLFPFSSEQRSSKSLILESFLLFFFDILHTVFILLVFSSPFLFLGFVYISSNWEAFPNLHPTHSRPLFSIVFRYKTLSFIQLLQQLQLLSFSDLVFLTWFGSFWQIFGHINTNNNRPKHLLTGNTSLNSVHWESKPWGELREQPDLCQVLKTNIKVNIELSDEVLTEVIVI